jgi:hypothetical protein
MTLGAEARETAIKSVKSRSWATMIRDSARERHDLAIRQPGITPVVEMHGVMPQGPQACGSLGCDPHVAQQLHAGAVSLGSTVSSASQAT